METIFRKEGKSIASVNYIFCTDDALLEINRQFLSHDYYTDIITFDLTEPGSKAITAEIHISVDRVKDNAKTHNSTFINELHRVLFHGILHLCGYKDKKPADIKAMRTRENYYLTNYFE